MKAALPKIRVNGADPFAIKRILLWSPRTQIARLSNECSPRGANPLGKVERDLGQAAMPRDAFLRSPGCEVELMEICGMDHPDFCRVVELVNKIGQFNTNATRRGDEDYVHH